MSEAGGPGAAGPAGDDSRDGPLVLQDHRGTVLWLTLHSPHNRNALSSRLLDELRGALRRAGEDRSVRVVVLTGSGPVFCSGADLHERIAERAAGAPGGAEEKDAQDRKDAGNQGNQGNEVTDSATPLSEVLSLLVHLPQPVVARVNGHVRAGGIGLVAAADVAVAPASATFAFSEVRVGVAPAIIAVPALRVMHRRAFARYALTGETFWAHDARAAGLLTATVADDGLDEWVDDVVAGFLRGSPDAITTTKRLFEVVWEQDWDSAVVTAESMSKEAFASADAAEGMSAFLQKRDPSWVVEP